MLNILSWGLFKTGVLKVRKLCPLDAHGEHCLLIAVYNNWGSTMKKLTTVVSVNCVRIMVIKYFEYL